MPEFSEKMNFREAAEFLSARGIKWILYRLNAARIMNDNVYNC